MGAHIHENFLSTKAALRLGVSLILSSSFQRFGPKLFHVDRQVAHLLIDSPTGHALSKALCRGRKKAFSRPDTRTEEVMRNSTWYLGV